MIFAGMTSARCWRRCRTTMPFGMRLRFLTVQADGSPFPVRPSLGFTCSSLRTWTTRGLEPLSCLPLMFGSTIFRARPWSEPQPRASGVSRAAEPDPNLAKVEPDAVGTCPGKGSVVSNWNVIEWRRTAGSSLSRLDRDRRLISGDPVRHCGYMSASCADARVTTSAPELQWLEARVL